jgi:putative PIN family toxin of toxin-antitoxin system
MQLVVDTNVLVSGLINPEGPPGRILDNIVQGIIAPVYNPAILAEYETVLARPKFAFEPEHVTALLEQIVSEGRPIPRVARLDIHFRDPGDRPFYECAAAAGCALVTGNAKDFPIKGIVEILSPAQLVRRLRK